MGGVGRQWQFTGTLFNPQLCFFFKNKKRYHGMCHRRRRTETFFFLQLLGIRGDLLLLSSTIGKEDAGLISFPFTAVRLSILFPLHGRDET